MKTLLIILAAVAASLVLIAIAASAGTSSPSRAVSHAQDQAPLLTLPRAAAAGQSTLFGHIHSLELVGNRYELRFDPALWLTGITAQRAKGSKDVPNDYFILDTDHRLLTYIVPKTARVTILTRGTNTTPISVARLSQRVADGKTKHNGFWLLIGKQYPSPVLTIDQQYQP
jgi:hypothetical protein